MAVYVVVLPKRGFVQGLEGPCAEGQAKWLIQIPLKMQMDSFTGTELH